MSPPSSQAQPPLFKQPDSSATRRKPDLFGKDDLFGAGPVPTAVKPKAKPSAPVTKSKEDDFDDLFGPPKKTTKPAKVVSGASGGGLFEEVDTDRQVAKLPSPQPSKPKASQPSLDDDLFGPAPAAQRKQVDKGDDDDLFGEAPRKPNVGRKGKKEPDEKPATSF